MTYPAFAELVPHTEPMVLLDALVDWREGEAHCVFEVKPRTPFVHDGVLRSPMLLEHMAQAVAACLGYEAFRSGIGVRVGMIIACKQLEVFVDEVTVGTSLDVHVRRTRGSDVLSHFDCRVERAGERVVTSTLTLFHAEKPPGT